MRMDLFICSALLALTILSQNARASDANCRIKIIAACGSGQCSAQYQQQLYSQCMAADPPPVYPQNECNREVDRVCAQGGCPATVVREIYTKCMLRR